MRLLIQNSFGAYKQKSFFKENKRAQRCTRLLSKANECTMCIKQSQHNNTPHLKNVSIRNLRVSGHRFKSIANSTQALNELQRNFFIS